MKSTSVILATLLLVACGSSDPPQPVEAAGRLHGGTLQGVDFQTATRKGRTDASGRFTYLPGETVTFSVGAVVLGSAPGAPDITLFTLAGGTPPTTERTLRRELDRAWRVPTPFTRAINMAHLLIAMDADGNPDNGLDVGASQDSRSPSPVDFDQGLIRFAAGASQWADGLTTNIPAWRPVVYLYASLGIQVAAHAPEHYLQESSPGPPGWAEQRFAYHASGLRASANYHLFPGAAPDLAIRYQYDAMGRITATHTEYNFDFDDTIDLMNDLVTTYDIRGHFLGSVQHDDVGADGETDRTTTTELQILVPGRHSRQITRTDADQDGDIDSILTYDTVFDPAILVQTIEQLEDTNADGITDARVTAEYRWLTRDRIQSWSESYDYDVDGTIDYHTSQRFFYDESPGSVRVVQETDSYGDGLIDHRIVTWRVLDAQGDERSSITETDYEADGAVDMRTVRAATYDRDRRLLTLLEQEDLNGDGHDELWRNETNEYGDAGQILGTIEDVGNDTGLQWRTLTEYRYGADAELLGWTRQGQPGAGGYVPSSSEMTATHITLANGVGFLAQYYLQYGAFGGVAGGFVSQ